MISHLRKELENRKKDFPDCAVHATTLQNGVADVKVFISEMYMIEFLFNLFYPDLMYCHQMTLEK